MRRLPLKPRPAVARWRRQQHGRQAGERQTEWGREIRRGPCVMCAAFPPSPEERYDYGPEIGRPEAHHILPKASLRDLARRLGFELAAALEDIRNGLCLCEFHHARHTNFVARVPRRLLPDGVHDFAAELNIEWLLDREYPELS